MIPNSAGPLIVWMTPYVSSLVETLGGIWPWGHLARGGPCCWINLTIFSIGVEESNHGVRPAVPLPPLGAGVLHHGCVADPLEAFSLPQKLTADWPN
jgi:hypothetical protein